LWTLYNANFQTIRGNLLRVKHIKGRQYYDVWNNRLIKFKEIKDMAELDFDIGPRSIGCIIQRDCEMKWKLLRNFKQRWIRNKILIFVLNTFVEYYCKVNKLKK
jgi:hypothetical protein